MPASKIPHRQPINDFVNGLITRIGDAALLSLAPLADGEKILSGELALRYGIPYLGKYHVSIVPDLVVLDYGAMLTGEEAWDFLMKKSHLYPRSEVLGYRNDGSEDMLVLKQLDFDCPYEVFVYTDADEHQPLCSVNALVASEDAAFPERLLQHLRRFRNLDDWREHG